MTQPTVLLPKHTHYVSIENDGIYPALSSPSGYEDEHPGEYRPATAAEIEKYKRGAEGVVQKPLPVDSGLVGIAAPATIKLADEALPIDIVPPAMAPGGSVSPLPSAVPPPPPPTGFANNKPE